MVNKRQPASAHVSMLGRFAVTLLGEDHALASHCQRLVGFLGIRGPLPISRTRTAAILWPSVDQEKASNQLRTCLYRLGDASNQLVERTDQTLRLAPTAVVDYQLAVERGRALCSAAAESVGESDLDTFLFKHDLLPGWDQDWVVVERESFRQLRFAALEAIARRCVDLSRNETAIQACLLVTRTEPLRESAHRLIAMAHAAQGNHAQALSQLNRYADLLQQEIGIPPSALVVDLRRELSRAVED